MPITEQSIRDDDNAAQAAGTGAPRVVYDNIKAKIVAENYIQNMPFAPLLTICVLTMRNGFTVVGTSACASPENFNAEFGRELAWKDAIRQLWGLEGYLLRERIADEGRPLDTAADPG